MAFKQLSEYTSSERFDGKQEASMHLAYRKANMVPGFNLLTFGKPSDIDPAGVDGAELPQIEEHPVAFAIYILSPNNWVTSFAYGVSPQPAQAPENSSNGCLNWDPLTDASLNFSTTSSL